LLEYLNRARIDAEITLKKKSYKGLRVNIWMY
jgi:hypothetical protein